MRYDGEEEEERELRRVIEKVLREHSSKAVFEEFFGDSVGEEDEDDKKGAAKGEGGLMISSRPGWVMWVLGGFAVALSYFGIQGMYPGGVMEILETISEQQMIWMAGFAVFGIVVLVLNNLARNKDVTRKEKEVMESEKNGQVYEKLFNVAGRALKKAERTQAELAELPEIGEVPEFIDVLERNTKGLRKALSLPVGAEFQVQVVQWLASVSEALIKSQELKLRFGLIQEKAGLSSALRPTQMRYRLLSAKDTLRQIEELMPETMDDADYDLQPYRVAVENYVKQLFAAELNLQFAEHVGLELAPGYFRPLGPMESLTPGEWDPSKALPPPGEEEHPMDRLFTGEEKRDRRKEWSERMGIIQQEDD